MNPSPPNAAVQCVCVCAHVWTFPPHHNGVGIPERPVPLQPWFVTPGTPPLPVGGSVRGDVVCLTLLSILILQIKAQGSPLKKSDGCSCPSKPLLSRNKGAKFIPDVCYGAGNCPHVQYKPLPRQIKLNTAFLHYRTGMWSYFEKIRDRIITVAYTFFFPHSPSFFGCKSDGHH